MTEFVSISIDYLLIGRCLGALCWGIIYAFLLQYWRAGRFLANERTWLAVVIGVAIDGLIAYGGDWWTCAAVVVCSSVGIIVRSLVNESRPDRFNPNSYRMKQNIEEACGKLAEVVEVLERALDGGQMVDVSRALMLVHQARELMRAARWGE